MITKLRNNFRQKIQNIEGSLQNSKRLQHSLAMYYQENSKLSTFDLVKMGEQVGRFSNPYILERAAQPYKCFPTAPTYNLEEYIQNTHLQRDIFETIRNRRSVRHFCPYPISLNEIANILFYSYGITHEEKIYTGKGKWSYRAVPSGGALYPLELYLFVRNSAIPEGIYHYRPDKNRIEYVKEIHGDELKKMVLGEPNVDMTNYCCIAIITSVFDRILMKYGERGYRFILQEAGFVGENISLITEAIGLSSCMIGSYLDDQINILLDADGVFESVQNVIVIGKKTE